MLTILARKSARVIPTRVLATKYKMGWGTISAPAAPTPVPIGAPLNYIGGNMYTLDALRLTTKGYWVQVTNGATDFDIMIGNASW